jgi:hypothetical protein
VNSAGALDFLFSRDGRIPHVPTFRDYAVFGGVLRSELHFPELLETDCGSPDWTLTIASASAPASDAVPLGERTVGGESYRLARTSAGLRLEYSHAGCFEISSRGSEIVWQPTTDANVELARAIVLGPALALALEANGLLCLHGSAVAIGDRAVAFLAPKHHGKSTLALALTAGGARLISDDTLAVGPGPPAMLRPGTASVRVWDDTARALRVAQLCTSMAHGAKITMSGFEATRLMDATVALDSVYLLTPIVASTAPRPVARTLLSAPAGAIALSRHAKVPDSLSGLDAAGVRLKAAATVAATVPVYTLYVARDFDILPEIIQQLQSWHGTASTSLTSVGR